MCKEVENKRWDLLKAIKSLGYGEENAVLFDCLPEVLRQYKNSRDSGEISDFMVIPHRETDPEGLSYGKHYVVYTRR